MAEELPENIQRWTAKRRAALEVSILRGETSVQQAARQHGLTVGEIEEWQERFLAAAENALRSRPKDEAAVKDEQIKQLKQKIGELVLDLDILRGERALEEACIRRFGTLRPSRITPVMRSDNGLVFQSRRFRGACRQYGLRQEFITPCTPQQNGIVERFFRSLKEQCVSVELTRFRGHPITWVKGVHDAEVTPAVPAGVSAADGRAGPGGTITRRAPPGIRALGADDPQLGPTGRSG